MIMLPNAARRAVVDALIAEDGLLDGAVVNLYQNDLTPTPNTLVGDFTVANFTGYAVSSAIVWGTVFTDASNVANSVGDVKQFTCTADGTAQTIYGYYVTVTGALRFSERFPTPIPVVHAADAVVVLPRFSFGQ